MRVPLPLVDELLAADSVHHLPQPRVERAVGHPQFLVPGEASVAALLVVGVAKADRANDGVDGLAPVGAERDLMDGARSPFGSQWPEWRPATSPTGSHSGKVMAARMTCPTVSMPVPEESLSGLAVNWLRCAPSKAMAAWSAVRSTGFSACGLLNEDAL